MNLSEGTTLQGGKYRIEKCLGQGGFGITYLAEWKQRKAKVAIKEFFIQELCYRDEQSSQITVLSEGGRRTVEHFRKKFLREAETIFNLNHPNIIRIYDVFEENGTAYYVMEYHSNGSLADKLKKMNGAPLPEADALRYTKQVADALAYIHEQKMPVIENEEVKKRSLRHLDIKPGNIMINERGEAVLIDFGLVKVYDEEGKPLNTTSSTLNGFSPGFAPLEQMQGSSSSIFTPATDIYALGATLYNLIEGRIPPLAGDVLKMKGNLPFSDTTSEPIRKAITEAMRPIDEDRPQSIAEFLKLLPQKDTDLNVVYKKRLEEGIALFQAGEYAKALSRFFELENLFPDHKAEIEEWMNKFLELMSDSDSGEGKTVQRKPVPPKPVSPTPPKPTPTPTPWRKIGGGALLLALLVVLCFIFRPGSYKGKGGNEETPDSVSSLETELYDHEYVDLGLSVKWATCNVGASKPSDYGSYFAWGEIEPKTVYTKENSVTYKKSFSDIAGNAQYDVARANWGGSWRLPTVDEIIELTTMCKWRWISLDGHNGYNVTGPSGKSIFLPASGLYSDTLLYVEEEGYYYSSTSDESKSWDCHFLFFDSNDYHLSHGGRKYGRSIRPVSE